jgi:hypothetical protein
MADISEFEKIMNSYAVRIPKNVNKVIQKVALVIDTSLVINTPIDTGKAKSNWVASLNSPAKSVRDSYVPGKKRSTESAVIQAALEQAHSIVTGYDSTKGDTIYLSNSADHIVPLNTGTSKQHPGMFIEIAIAEGKSIISTKEVTVTGTGF